MGQLDVDTMLAGMTSAQVGGWMEYYGVEPWGEYSADRRSAEMCTAVLRSQGSKCKCDDFMPSAWRSKVTQSWKTMKNQLMGLVKNK
jgi:hypothetical protein